MAHYLSHRAHDSYINVLLLALALGFLFPSVFTPLSAYASFLLQSIFFLSSLKIDLRSVSTELRDWKAVTLVTFFMLLLLPAATYVLFRPLFPDLALPLLLLAAMPAGMTSPLFAEMLRGNVSLALVLTVFTSLFAPFTIPFVVTVFGGETVTLDTLSMFSTLFSVIFLPFVLAQGVRIFVGQERIGKAKKGLAVSSVVLVCLLLASITAKYSDSMIGRFHADAIVQLLGMFFFFALVHVAAYLLVWWRNVRDRLTVTLCIVYMNFTLAIFIAQEFFPDPDVVFFTMLSIIPWNIGIILFRSVSERWLRKGEV